MIRKLLHSGVTIYINGLIAALIAAAGFCAGLATATQMARLMLGRS